MNVAKYMGDVEKSELFSLYSFACAVLAYTIDRKRRQDCKRQEWEGVVPRIPRFAGEFVGRESVTGWIFSKYDRRPDNEGLDPEAYRQLPRTRVRACAACLEGALLMLCNLLWASFLRLHINKNKSLKIALSNIPELMQKLKCINR